MEMTNASFKTRGKLLREARGLGKPWKTAAALRCRNAQTVSQSPRRKHGLCFIYTSQVPKTWVGQCNLSKWITGWEEPGSTTLI